MVVFLFDITLGFDSKFSRIEENEFLFYSPL